MTFWTPRIQLLFIICVSIMCSPNVIASPRQPVPLQVLVTVKPVHSLVAAVMEGVGTPTLLMDGKISPHHHQLRPSEEQQVNTAQVIVWVGEIYETSLKKRIDNRRNLAHIITVSEFSGLNLYPYRAFGPEGPHTCSCMSPHHHHTDTVIEEKDHDHEIPGKDGHLWLAPNNAKILVTQVAKKLAALDLQHAPRYLANSQKVIKEIDLLARELAEELKDIKDEPYIIFHDFTQYFDRYFGTKCIGVVRLNPSIDPSPKHLQYLRKQIKAKETNAVFIEPQFPSKLIRALRQEHNLNIAELDYLGYGLEAGPRLYFEMMRRLAVDMKKALDKDCSFLSLIQGDKFPNDN